MKLHHSCPILTLKANRRLLLFVVLVQYTVRQQRADWQETSFPDSSQYFWISSTSRGKLTQRLCDLGYSQHKNSGAVLRVASCYYKGSCVFTFLWSRKRNPGNNQGTWGLYASQALLVPKLEFVTVHDDVCAKKVVFRKSDFKRRCLRAGFAISQIIWIQHAQG